MPTGVVFRLNKTKRWTIPGLHYGSPQASHVGNLFANLYLIIQFTFSNRAIPDQRADWLSESRSEPFENKFDCLQGLSGLNH